MSRNDSSRESTDLRIRRTRERLGAALIALLEDKPIEEVTMRQVLDRAGVGRSTFYLHYRFDFRDRAKQ
jgi:AcrR family transcriptional regulator